MIRLQRISPSGAWRPDNETLHSFAGSICCSCRILGSSRLVRLLSVTGQSIEGEWHKANSEEGSYWFAESDFQRVRREAVAKVHASGESQRHLAKGVAFYVRDRLRNALAISRNWTPRFDYFVVLTVPNGASLTAFEGRVASQPVYSADYAGGEAARKAGLELKGRFQQFVIDFKFPANQAAVNWIGPAQIL